MVDVQKPLEKKENPVEKKENPGDTQKPIDKQLVVLKANLTRIQAEMSEEKAQKKDHEAARDTLLEFGPPAPGTIIPDTENNTNLEDKLELAEKEYMAALREKHNAEMKEIILKSDFSKIDKTAIKKGVVEYLWSTFDIGNSPEIKKKIGELEIKIQAEEKYKKMTPLQKTEEMEMRKEIFINDIKKQSIEEFYKQVGDDFMDKLRDFQKLTPEKQKEAKQKAQDALQKAFKEFYPQLSQEKQKEITDKSIDFFINAEEKIKTQIAENVTKKGLVISGIIPTSEMGEALSEQQRKTLRSTIENVGENPTLSGVPLDIRERLLLEDENSGEGALVKEGDLPDKMVSQIERTKRDIFRKKENETDTTYAQRVNKQLKENVGSGINEIAENYSKLPWLARIIIAGILRIGVLLGGELGERCKKQLEKLGLSTNTDKNKNKNNDNSGYGGYSPEGSTESPKNRESHIKNLENYKGTHNPELPSTIKKINANDGRYKEVSTKLEKQTGKKIPWEVIAAIHYREGDMNFNTYLHNGDRLGKPTTSVPAGIEFPNTPDGWVDAAVDALKRETYFDNMNTDSIEGLANIAEYAERYNGTKYRKSGMNSPYVWAGSDGVKVAGLIMKDHGPITNYQDKRLGIMPIVLELAGYTVRGDLNENKKMSKATEAKNTPEELTGTNADYFRKNTSVRYGHDGDNRDCMSSVDSALGLNYETKSKQFRDSHIDKNEKKEDLWNVSMVAALYAGIPIQGQKDDITMQEGYFGGKEKANDPGNIAYHIEENIMKRTEGGKREEAKGDKGTVIHYGAGFDLSEITKEVGSRLGEGQSAIMGGTGKGTNDGGHEWLVVKENGELKVYESTKTEPDDWRGRVDGINGKGYSLIQYLTNRKAQHPKEATIFSVRDSSKIDKRKPETAQSPSEVYNASNKITGEQLSKKLPNHLQSLALYYIIAGRKYGINPLLLASISIHEVGPESMSKAGENDNYMGISDDNGALLFSSKEENEKTRINKYFDKMKVQCDKWPQDNFDSYGKGKSIFMQAHKMKYLKDDSGQKYVYADCKNIADLARIYAPGTIDSSGRPVMNNAAGKNKDWYPGVSKYYRQLSA